MNMYVELVFVNDGQFY